jgi:putative phosphonate metabolism protein
VSQAFVKEAVEKGEFMSYSRFAIYYVPPAGPLADFGASWLGWDVVNGQASRQPDLPDLRDITMTPRKYGFHGTLKPPFRLKDGRTVADLEKAVAELAASLAPAVCDGLALTTLGRFLALTPHGDTETLQRVAAACVSALDDFRAPASNAELARRRASGLTARQDALLVQWGYPYVMEEFRFHLTLSGQLPEAELTTWSDTVRKSLPALPAPFILDQIALCGEREDGHFEMLHRYTLAG